MKLAKAAAAVTLLVISTIFAAAADPATNTAKPKLPKGLPIYGKVGAIDKQAGTVTLQGKEKVRIFYVTAQTRVHRDGQPAKLDDVVIGQWIGGYARPDANGRSTLSTLNLAVVQRTPSGAGPESPQKPRSK